MMLCANGTPESRADASLVAIPQCRPDGADLHGNEGARACPYPMLPFVDNFTSLDLLGQYYRAPFYV